MNHIPVPGTYVSWDHDVFVFIPSLQRREFVKLYLLRQYRYIGIKPASSSLDPIAILSNVRVLVKYGPKPSRFYHRLYKAVIIEWVFLCLYNRVISPIRPDIFTQICVISPRFAIVSPKCHQHCEHISKFKGLPTHISLSKRNMISFERDRVVHEYSFDILVPHKR